jgi:uncharacterized protein with HEPN domain
MSQHDDTVRLRHMLEYARRAVAVSENRSRGDLDSDPTLGLALVRLLEVIGEAAARMTKEYQASHPSIPWRSIINLRNRLIHGYDSVDMDILWRILTDDLRHLIGIGEDPW